MTLIVFSAYAPHPLAAELSSAGLTIYEAIAISEVLALAEQHPEAQIVISAEVETERAGVIQQHCPTLHLKFDATAADVVWDLGLPHAGRAN